MSKKERDRKATISKDGRSVEYSRDEIETLLPNLADELKKDPIVIPPSEHQNSPRTQEEIEEVTKSQYDQETELFLPKTEDFLRRCSTLEEAEEIIDHQLKIHEITKEQADYLRELCRKHGVRYFGGKKEWGYYEKTYRTKRSSI